MLQPRLPSWLPLIVGALVLDAGSPAAGQPASEGPQPSPEPVSPAALIEVPPGLPEVPVPEDSPFSAATVDLGRRLFFEPALSSDGTVSCGTCHQPDETFADDAALSLGVEGQKGHRNAPSILNAAYYPVLLWDGRSTTLEDQVRYPLTHPKEMSHTMSGAVEALEGNPPYPELFQAAFGEEGITYEKVTQALAAYERTLLSGDSPFDRFFFGGRDDELSAASRRGWELFRGRAGCIECHRFDAESPFFTDFEFHNTGIGWDREDIDLGRFKITRDPSDRGKFRTPSLRNVALTAPYMHDGRFETLAQVLDFYEDGGIDNKFLDPALAPVELSERDRSDLVAFLESLTGSSPSGDDRGEPPTPDDVETVEAVAE